MAGTWQQVIQRPGVSLCAVGGHLGRSRAVPQRAGEEPAGGRQIPLLRDQHVDDLPELIDRTVEVDPPTGDLDIGFIGEPAIAQSVSARLGCVDHQGREALYPAVDRDVVDGDATFGEQFFDVAVGQSIAQIPPHRQHDDLTGEAKPRETRLRWRYSTTATAHQLSLPEAVIHQRNSTRGRPPGYLSLMTLRVGIVGCGAITAFAHVPALLRRKPALAEVAALCDRNLERAERVKQRFRLRAYCTTDADRLIADPSLDAIIVATWPSEHVQLAIEAIESGRHVLIQKPLTVSERESVAMVSAAENTHLNVMALPVVATVPSLSALKLVIDSEDLGVIRYTRIRTSISGPRDHYQDVRRFFGEDEQTEAPIFGKAYAQGGGCLSDMGPYALALFQYLHGQGELLTAVRNKRDFETVALLNLRVPDDSGHSTPLCTIEVGWSQHPTLEVCSVFGSQGAATVTVDGSLQQWPMTDKIPQPADAVRSIDGVLPTSPVAGQDEWLDAIATSLDAAFVDSVRQAAWAANVIADAYKMSELHTWNAGLDGADQ